MPEETNVLTLSIGNHEASVNRSVAYYSSCAAMSATEGGKVVCYTNRMYANTAVAWW
jgi:hypothetical protein